MPSASRISLSVTGHAAPDISGQRHERIAQGDAGHQEDDDVVDRERNQKKRKTDHRRGLLFKRTKAFRTTGSFLANHRGSPPETVLPHALAEFRQARCRIKPVLSGLSL